MMYRVLAEPLQPCADLAAQHFKAHFGLAGVKVESELDASIAFRPTFHGRLPDGHLLCAEVADAPLPPGIHEFIIEARNESLPARLWVVIPRGQVNTVSTKDLGFLRENGVGLLEISDQGVASMLAGPPLSMSLTGLRQFKLSDFPAKQREDIRKAIDTFKGGNPAKGCAEVYDVLEQLTRRILMRADKVSNGLRQAYSGDPAKDAWASILEFLRKQLDRQATGCPLLTTQLFNRLIGITEFRNETGHKPKNLAQLKARDRQLRTRFEGACDELLTLIRASAPLRP
jgi:hypothetical protein